MVLTKLANAVVQDKFLSRKQMFILTEHEHSGLTDLIYSLAS